MKERNEFYNKGHDAGYKADELINEVDMMPYQPEYQIGYVVGYADQVGVANADQGYAGTVIAELTKKYDLPEKIMRQEVKDYKDDEMLRAFDIKMETGEDEFDESFEDD